MRKQQNFTASGARASVHLRGAAWRRNQHAVGETACKLYGLILASTIDHDDFADPPAQLSQRTEHASKGLPLIEDGNND